MHGVDDNEAERKHGDRKVGNSDEDYHPTVYDQQSLSGGRSGDVDVVDRCGKDVQKGAIDSVNASGDAVVQVTTGEETAQNVFVANIDELLHNNVLPEYDASPKHVDLMTPEKTESDAGVHVPHLQFPSLAHVSPVVMLNLVPN